MRKGSVPYVVGIIGLRENKLNLHLLELEVTEFFFNSDAALARWLSWVECPPVHSKVAGSFPGQGTHLVCRFDPQSGHMQEATNRCFSPTLMFLSL